MRGPEPEGVLARFTPPSRTRQVSILARPPYGSPTPRIVVHGGRTAGWDYVTCHDDGGFSLHFDEPRYVLDILPEACRALGRIRQGRMWTSRRDGEGRVRRRRS